MTPSQTAASLVLAQVNLLEAEVQHFITLNKAVGNA